MLLEKGGELRPAGRDFLKFDDNDPLTGDILLDASRDLPHLHQRTVLKLGGTPDEHADRQHQSQLNA